MNILFLTISKIYDLKDHDIYQDLMRTFNENGHNVYIVTPSEKRNGNKTCLYQSENCNVLKVKVGNLSNCSLIEKGISTVTLKYSYLHAIKKYLSTIKFDLILYATPPITIMPIVLKLKKKNNAKSYLMLKDIFPQNAVDLKMFGKSSILYKYFRHLEEKLYKISDYIGCMSPANQKYLQEHNNIPKDKIEICPNAIIPMSRFDGNIEIQNKLKEKYCIPDDRIVLIYGGNLGKPQGIDFLIKCLEVIKNDDRFVMLIVGGGSEYHKLDEFLKEEKASNIKLIERLERKEYFNLVSIADVGMIFLDYQFTIPNFPSRILPYMENAMPIACVVDTATDIGNIVEKNNFGWKCKSNDIDEFKELLERIAISNIKEKGELGRLFLEENYTSDRCYKIIREKMVK